MIRKQTKHPRLLKERLKLIKQCFADGFILVEVAEIFRMTPANINQIKGRASGKLKK